MKLPPNPLDELIDKLGGVDKVAEMTGRSIHLVRKNVIVEDGKVENKIVVEKRNKSLKRECNLDEVNLLEKDSFLNEEKCIAIISEAASSGISLQADKRVKNQRRYIYLLY